MYTIPRLELCGLLIVLELTLNMTQLLSKLYIPTQLNPVDCASRGLFPSELIDHPLWWTGPSFLRNTDDQWPKSMSSLPDGVDIMASSESKLLPVLLINVDDCLLDLLERIPSFGKFYGLFLIVADY